MADLSTADSFLPGDGEERVAVYRRRQRSAQASSHECDSCGKAIPGGCHYVRVQVVIERKGEDLNDRLQARSVDYQRRVIMKFHPHCEPAL